MDWTTLALALVAALVPPLVAVLTAWLRRVLRVSEYDLPGQDESDRP